ncbi:MAG: ParB/RepB/Spo0J family partition protein [Pseudomonadota bacterium]
MPYNLQTVCLSEINKDEETFRITTTVDAGSLVASIVKVGLIHPPILIQRDSRFVVVSGFRRIAAVRLLKFKQFSARILDSMTSHLDCVQLAIADNAFQRSLNPIEISRGLSLLSPCFENESELSQTARALGLPDSAPLIKKLIPLCNLPWEVREGVINNSIPPQVARMLCSLDTQDAIWLALIFNSLKISLNKQREIITLSQEIAHREDLPLGAVFAEKELCDILHDPDLDRSRKAAALRSYLKHRRFPALTRAKDAFEEMLKSLKLDASAKLIAPVDFEGRHFTLNLTFKELGELERHKNTIDRIARHHAMKRLTDPAAE